MPEAWVVMGISKSMRRKVIFFILEISAHLEDGLLGFSQKSVLLAKVNLQRW
jgi:hypothetical protein